MTDIDSLKEKLIRLNLIAMAQQLDEVLLEAQQKNQAYFLSHTNRSEVRLLVPQETDDCSKQSSRIEPCW